MALGSTTREVEKFTNNLKNSQPAEPENVENNVKPQEANVQPVVEGNDPSSVPDDLIQRISNFENENKEILSSDNGNVEFNTKELKAAIEELRGENPKLAELLDMQQKSFNKGVSQKFEELSHMRKELQHNPQQLKQARFVANSIEDLLNNPEFVREAQSYQGEDDDDPVVQARKMADERIKKYENEQLAKQQQEQWNRYHMELSSKYGQSYNPREIDQVASQLASGEIQATPEYIYKVLNFDKATKNSYQIGYREGLKIAKQKQNINSPESLEATTPITIKQEEGESNKDFFKKLSAGFLSGQLK